jgi:hypothetical protein
MSHGGREATNAACLQRAEITDLRMGGGGASPPNRLSRLHTPVPKAQAYGMGRLMDSRTPLQARPSSNGRHIRLPSAGWRHRSVARVARSLDPCDGGPTAAIAARSFASFSRSGSVGISAESSPVKTDEAVQPWGQLRPSSALSYRRATPSARMYKRCNLLTEFAPVTVPKSHWVSGRSHVYHAGAADTWRRGCCCNSLKLSSWEESHA